ncbi:MAG: hypothetical protein ACJASQ_002834 [Crocinitomicaceae bacterium]|jgi:hypothetical protein
MIRSLTVTFFLSSFIVFSQEDVTELKQEIGLNLAPVIIPLFTGDFDINRVEISYVRHQTTNFSWRIKLSASRTYDGGAITPSAYSDLYRTDTIYSNSSLTEIRRHYQKEVNVLRAFASVEYVKRFEFAHFYTGIGIVPGIAKNKSFAYRSEFETGTSLGSTWIDGISSFRSFMLGGSPYVGLKLPIAKRLVLNFQTGIEFDYHFRDVRLVESSERIKVPRSKFLIWPVLTELGIYLKF